MFQFRIQKDLRDRWFMVIIQHLNLFLMPLRGHFKSATVYLYSIDEGAGPAAGSASGNDRVYSCDIKIGGMEKVSCQHRDPLIAIAQAMARTKRHLSRQLQLRETAAS